ncbi:MAG: hypothetical protein IJZ32_02745 [Clostridia bacterium]|nr:hypothetical protein [Clostridia bacterium]
MGYGAEKRKVEGKAKKLKRWLLCILILCMVIGIVVATISSADSWKYKVNLPAVRKRGAGELRVHFLDLGESEATLIELPDGKTALIDGGEDRGNSEKTLLRYLNALDIDTVDYLVVTDTAETSCGGLDKLLEQKTVKTAYLPKKTPVSGSAYAKFSAALVKENCERAYLSRSIDLSANGYTLSFLYPYTMDVQNETETEGCAFWLEYSGVSTLFMSAPETVGDLLARDDRLGLFKNRGVELKGTDFLKCTTVPSSEFLEYLGAERIQTEGNGHTILTVGADGSYTLKTPD